MTKIFTIYHIYIYIYIHVYGYIIHRIVKYNQRTIQWYLQRVQVLLETWLTIKFILDISALWISIYIYIYMYIHQILIIPQYIQSIQWKSNTHPTIISSVNLNPSQPPPTRYYRFSNLKHQSPATIRYTPSKKPRKSQPIQPLQYWWMT